VVASQAGLPDASGGSNIRTRVAYDADGHAVAQFAPSAFATSTSNPNPAFMTRTDIDQDGRTTAVFQPRYDAGSHSDLGLSATQSAQCMTNPSPQTVPGVPGFPAGVGVCVTHYQYDAAGRHTRTVLATSNGSDNRYVDYSYTDDGLTAAVNSPSPAQNGARVTSASYLYDGDGKQVKQIDALGHQQTTSYTSDERVAQQAAQPNGSVTHVTKQSYDANGNPTATTDPLGNVPTISYYADNLTHDSIDGAGNDTRYVYDPAGNLVQKFSPSAVARDATNPQGITSPWLRIRWPTASSIAMPPATHQGLSRPEKRATTSSRGMGSHVPQRVCVRVTSSILSCCSRFAGPVQAALNEPLVGAAPALDLSLSTMPW
jgi:YD repeat-containing protein